MLCEHPFYEELSIVKTDHTVKDMSNWLRKKNQLIQLEASKSSNKDLFNDILDEAKGFMYQNTVKILLKNTKALKLIFFQSVLIQ